MFEIYVGHDCGPKLSAAVSGRPSFAIPDSEGCFSLVESWIRECTETHEGYCPSGLEGPLPTRVLDIGSDGEISNIVLKDTASEEVGAYVTLSHCVR